ncbi:hypothetical protein EMIHUDRAFT_247589, partial [Emiliania huxleyi CCMP1516]|uniref:CUB domain-containing protein n=2 Tax=Emiliania huxleyi TaxID=2903 RepID=A0A0D3ILA4_EMIH1
FTIPVAFRVLTGSEYCHLTISSDGRSCVTDGPGNYGDNEECTVEVLQTGLLSATEFNTESGYDYITIDSKRYQGAAGPSNLPVTAGTRFTWQSDGGVTDMGWTICFQQSPLPPPPPPWEDDPITSPWPDIAGYTPGSDVTKHANLDLDQQALVQALKESTPNWDLAEESYAVGGYSLSGKVPNGLRTMKGFSAGAEGKMYNGCAGCPYKTFSAFYDYYGDFDYADKWVSAALDGANMAFSSGRHGPNDFATLGDAARIEAVKKGTAYMNVWMYVIREFEDAIDDCFNCPDGLNCNDFSDSFSSDSPQYNAVHAWDEGVAFYAGSLEGLNVGGSSAGEMVYRLAEKRCANFGTCDETGLSNVNKELLEDFILGEELLKKGLCSNVRPIVDRIIKQMTVPLVQGSLRYAYKVGESIPGETVVGSDRSQKNAAEGAVFTAAVLPLVHECNVAAAKTISDKMKFGLYDQGVFPDFAAVKAAFESTYDCLGITSDDLTNLLVVLPISAGSVALGAAASYIVLSDDQLHVMAYSCFSIAATDHLLPSLGILSREANYEYVVAVITTDLVESRTARSGATDGNDGVTTTNATLLREASGRSGRFFLQSSDDESPWGIVSSLAPAPPPSPPPTPCVHDDSKCSSSGNDCYTYSESEAQTCSDGYTASPHPDDPRSDGRYTCYPPHCRCDASKCSSRDGDDCLAFPGHEAQTCRDGYLPIAINDWHKCSSDGDDCWADPNMEAQTCSDGYTASPHPDEPRSDGRYTCYPPHCRCDASKCSSGFDDCWTTAGTPDDEEQTCRDGYLPIATNDWGLKCSSGGDDCWADPNMEAQTCSDGYTASPHPDDPRNEGRYTCYPPHCRCDASKCSSRDGDDCYASPPGEAQTCRDGYLPIATNAGHHKCSSGGDDCWADPNMEAQTCSDGYTASPHPDEPRNEGRYTCYPPHCRCDASKCSSYGDDCYADGTPDGEAQTCRDGYLPIAIRDWLKCSSGGDDCWADPNMEAQTCSDGYTASPHPDDPRNEGRYTCYPPHCRCDASKCSSRDGDDCYASPPGEAQTCRDGYLPIAIRDSHKCSSGGGCWADPNYEAQTCSDGYTTSPHPDDPRNEGRYTCYPPHCRCDASKCSSRDGDDCYASPPGEAQTCRDGYLPIAIRDSHSGGDCCGDDGGYCGSEWVSTDASTWIDTCTGLDFIRVSPGCGVEVATETGGGGETFTYDSSVLVCGYECEPRPTPGCDRVRSLRLFPLAPPPPPHPPFQPGQAPAPPPPSPCVHDDSKCVEPTCWADPNMEAQTCSDGYTASPHPDEPRNEGRYTCYPPHCRCDASKCSSRDGDDCYASPPGEAQTCRDGYLPIATNAGHHKCLSGGNDCWADPNMEAQTCSDGYTASPHPDEPRNEGRYTCYPPHCLCDASKCSSRDGDDCYASPPGEAQTCRDGYLPIAIRDSLKCSSGGDDCWADPNMEAQTCSDGYTASPHPDDPRNEGRYTCYPPHCRCDASKCSSAGGGDCYADGRPDGEAQTCRDGYLPIAIRDSHKCVEPTCWADPNMEAQTCSDGYTASPHPDDPRNEGRYTCYPPHCRCDASKCSSRDGDDCHADGTPYGEAQTCRDGYLPIAIRDSHKCSSGGDDCWADPNMEAQTCSDGYTASPHPEEPRNEGRYTCYPPHCRCDASKCSSYGNDCYASPPGEAQTCRDGYLPIAIRVSHKCSSGGDDCWADPNMEAQTCSDGYTASPHPDEPRNEGRYTCYPPHCRCDASKCSSQQRHCYASPPGEAQTCRDGYLPIAVRDSHKCWSGGNDCWADPNMEAQTCSDGYTASPHPDDPRNE